VTLSAFIETSVSIKFQNRNRFASPCAFPSLSSLVPRLYVNHMTLCTWYSGLCVYLVRCHVDIYLVPFAIHVPGTVLYVYLVPFVAHVPATVCHSYTWYSLIPGTCCRMRTWYFQWIIWSRASVLQSRCRILKQIVVF